jgi:hypothetical protein
VYISFYLLRLAAKKMALCYRFVVSETIDVEVQEANDYWSIKGIKSSEAQ